MIQKPLDAITKEDIHELLRNQVTESRTVEYKQSLPGRKDNDKKEFLADISSFANASGGDLIYGVTEERDSNGQSTGVPVDVPGVSIANTDELRLWIESVIRDGIAPRISVNIEFIDGFQEGSIVVIRVPNSWNAPHMIVFKRSSRFYSRTSAGKYQLDVTELRSAFNHSNSISKRIQSFRDGRMSKIVAGETPVTLADNPKIILHLVPLEAFSQPRRIQISQMDTIKSPKPVPFGDQWNTHRFNLDGFVTMSLSGDDAKSYAQFFRNGVVEICDGWLLADRREYGETVRFIPSGAFEERVITAVRTNLQFLNNVGVQPPYFFLASIVGVKGFRLAVRQSVFHDGHVIDRDMLMLPDVLIENEGSAIEQTLRPVFDALWQACGWPRSMNYDDSGQRMPR